MTGPSTTVEDFITQRVSEFLSLLPDPESATPDVAREWLSNYDWDVNVSLVIWKAMFE